MSKTLTDKYIEELRCSVLGHCPKRLAAPILQGPQEEDQKDAVDNPRFRDGHWHEYDVKTRLLKDNVRFESGIKTVTKVNFRLAGNILVPGHLDGIIQVDGTSKQFPLGRWLLEVKSMNEGTFWKLLKQGYQEGFPSYYDQIQAYLNSEYAGYGYRPGVDDDPTTPLYNMLNYQEEEEMPLPDMGLVIAKNKGSGQLKPLPILPDDSYADGLRRRWFAAIEAVDQLRWPERLWDSPDNNYECRSCPIRQTCWGELVGVPAIVTAPTPDQEAAAKMYQFGKTLGKFAEQLQDASRPALEPEDAGKIQLGPLSINKYPTKHVLWNHKLVEQMLSPEQVQMVKVEKGGFATRIDVEEMKKEEIQEAMRALLERPEAVGVLEGG